MNYCLEHGSFKVLVRQVLLFVFFEQRLDEREANMSTCLPVRHATSSDWLFSWAGLGLLSTDKDQQEVS